VSEIAWIECFASYYLSGHRLILLKITERNMKYHEIIGLIQKPSFMN
jgi:hypothetical protein